MRAIPNVACLLFLLSSLDVTAARARELAVTVYNQDLGVIRDRRAVDVTAGRSMLKIADVAAGIDPTSVHLEGDLKVVEQNYAFDLVSAGKVLQRYVGQPIDVVADDGRSYRGRLLSFDRESLVLGGVGGGEEVTLIGREGVQDIRCPSLPEGLITKPTLIWTVEGARGGKTEVELSYMTVGMSWHAEYAALVAPDDDKMDLSAWVSIENHSGASYPDARLKLVAGEVHRAPEPRAEFKLAGQGLAMYMQPEFEERGLFEYHIYVLERTSTIADREIKQLSLFPPATAPVRKIFEFDGGSGDSEDRARVKVLLEAENTEAAGLGVPLPAGKVRAFKADADGRLEFVGEDWIGHTPRGEKVTIKMGDAFDVVGERTVVDHKRINDRSYRETVEVKLRNRKAEAVEVVVVEHPPRSWEILSTTHPYEKKEASRIEFTVPVTPDEEAVIRYTVRVR